MSPPRHACPSNGHHFAHGRNETSEGDAVADHNTLTPEIIGSAIAV